MKYKYSFSDKQRTAISENYPLPKFSNTKEIKYSYLLISTCFYFSHFAKMTKY